MRKKLLSLLIVLMLCVICTVSITMAAVEETVTTPAETLTPVTTFPLYQNVTTQTLVVSVPPGTPEIPPFLNYLYPRTQSEMNPAPGTLPNEIRSTADSETYVFVTKWGTDGSGDGQFNTPMGIAADSSGIVYVTDYGSSRIQKFNSDGTFLTKWGSYGSGNGQFKYPRGVAVDLSDNVYVADTDNNRIQKFSSDGIFLAKWGSVGSGDGQFYSPNGVAIDSSGNIYIADTLNHRIQKLSPTGIYLTQWGTLGTENGEFHYPTCVAVDLSGNVYVVDSNNRRIQKFSSTGTYLTQWGWGMGLGGVAVDSSSNVYVTDLSENCIQKFDSTELYITKWGSLGYGDGRFQSPYAVAVDSLGNVYVADTGNYRIQKFTPYVETPPVADFSGTPTSGSAPLTVTFTDNSTNTPTSWNWNFGDGGSSTYQNPSHTYASAGTYSVALNATNSKGSNTFTRTNYITVTAAPVAPIASFIGTPTSGSAPLTVLFSDTSSGSPTSWSWSFGDGSYSTDKNPWHIYPVAGTCTVSLTATNAAGSNTKVAANYITVSSGVIAPVANFAGAPTSGTAPLTVQFTDTSTGTPTSWNWSFGDQSSVNATQRNPVHTYVSNGTYTGSLNATNSAGSNTFTRSNYITVGSGQGLYIFTEEQNGATVYLNPTNTITLKLKDNPSTGYSWNLTTTDGLKVTGNSFQSSDTTGMLNGAGGIHSWNMNVVGTGEQKISGIYSRSWEPVTGNENQFGMTIVVA